MLMVHITRFLYERQDLKCSIIGIFFNIITTISVRTLYSVVYLGHKPLQRKYPLKRLSMFLDR